MEVNFLNLSSLGTALDSPPDIESNRLLFSIKIRKYENIMYIFGNKMEKP